MKKNGFTVIELTVTIAIAFLLASIAVPSFNGWLPNYRLKSATTDLLSNMQLARMGSVRDRNPWAVHFNNAGDSYRVCSNDGGDGDWTDGDEVVEKTVTLASYSSGVCFGHGNATSAIPGGPFGSDITYTNDLVIFDPRGTCGETGYVYLENRNSTTSYGVGTTVSGAVLIRKWHGAAWE